MKKPFLPTAALLVVTALSLGACAPPRKTTTQPEATTAARPPAPSAAIAKNTEAAQSPAEAGTPKPAAAPSTGTRAGNASLEGTLAGLSFVADRDVTHIFTVRAFGKDAAGATITKVLDGSATLLARKGELVIDLFGNALPQADLPGKGRQTLQSLNLTLAGGKTIAEVMTNAGEFACGVLSNTAAQQTAQFAPANIVKILEPAAQEAIAGGKVRTERKYGELSGSEYRFIRYPGRVVATADKRVLSADGELTQTNGLNFYGQALQGDVRVQVEYITAYEDVSAFPAEPACAQKDAAFTLAFGP
jgi:hypothetical protein